MRVRGSRHTLCRLYARDRALYNKFICPLRIGSIKHHASIESLQIDVYQSPLV